MKADASRNSTCLSFYCQEVYQSPNEGLRLAKELWKPFVPQNSQEVTACCAAHEEMWGLGFETDEDMVLQTLDPTPHFPKPRFFNRIPVDVESEIGARSGTHEIAVQTDEAGISPENWNYEALRLDATTVKRVSYVTQTEVNHKLEVRISEGVERSKPLATYFACKFCRKPFKNGQALGGHLSRCHPA
mmetsp:Transcript_24/g.28  ORF Transcript_24/g.28 Transcript_24/m.28 type:complete len:188 (-) Transcript_24:1355-1918(-)